MERKGEKEVDFVILSKVPSNEHLITQGVRGNENDTGDYNMLIGKERTKD